MMYALDDGDGRVMSEQTWWYNCFVKYNVVMVVIVMK